MSEQERLLDVVKKEFPGIPIVEVENKADLLKTASGRAHISASTGKGVQSLVDKLSGILSTVSNAYSPNA
jgi:nucleolar GTP-binding protein